MLPRDRQPWLTAGAPTLAAAKARNRHGQERLAGRPVAGEPCRVPDGSVPGGADSFHPRDLDNVRTPIVMPVATSPTRPGLPRRVDAGWGRGSRYAMLSRHLVLPWAENHMRTARSPGFWVAAIGELGQSPTWTPAASAPITRWAASPSRSLTGSKTGSANPIAWGEQRIACYLIPVRRPPARTRRSPIRAMRDLHRGNTGPVPAALAQTGAFRCDELSPAAGPA